MEMEMETISSSTMNTVVRPSQEAHNLHFGPLALNIYAPPSRTEMTIYVTSNLITGLDNSQAHPTPKIICGVGTWKFMLLIGPYTMFNNTKLEASITEKWENLHMFKRSYSMKLVFLGRGTYGKEIQLLLLFFHEYWNCYKFELVKHDWTHDRSIG